MVKSSVHEAHRRHPIWNAAVIVSALGYFVDIYDLILFSIVRVPSLKDLGLQGSALMDEGLLLMNLQMIGMLIGGILWGILGDKKGRLSVLFGSIILYSLANLANGFVQSIPQYAFLRLIAGIGLAGELGAGITLVAEVLPKHSRGIGTTIVAAFGICGAILAAQVAGIQVGNYPSWRVAYVIGGVLGFALLALRVSVFESEIFEKVKAKTKARGDFLYLFRDRVRFFKYLRCILIGVPVWYVIGILVSFSPEFSRELGVVGEVSASNAVMYAYIGLALGDLVSGLLSQWLGSRRKVVAIFLTLSLFVVGAYVSLHGLSVSDFYWICSLLGFGAGYWAIFVTIGAEQFGTNLRATVTTTVPNFVRGSVVPLTFLFKISRTQLPLIPAVLAVGFVAFGLAFLALLKMEETFGKDLSYIEEWT